MEDEELELEEIKTMAELRGLVAKEVEAKSNVLQAQTMIEQVKWTKLMTIGTFFMAVATTLVAAVQMLK